MLSHAKLKHPLSWHRFMMLSSAQSAHTPSPRTPQAHGLQDSSILLSILLTSLFTKSEPLEKHARWHIPWRKIVHGEVNPTHQSVDQQESSGLKNQPTKSNDQRVSRDSKAPGAVEVLAPPGKSLPWHCESSSAPGKKVERQRHHRLCSLKAWEEGPPRFSANRLPALGLSLHNTSYTNKI